LDITAKLTNFSGLKPGKDVEIVFTGLGPGEKLHEELYWQGEGIVPTENKKITMLKPNGLYPDRLYAQLKKLEEQCLIFKGRSPFHFPESFLAITQTK